MVLPRRTLLVKIYFIQVSHGLVGGLEMDLLKLAADLMVKKNFMYFYYLHKLQTKNRLPRNPFFLQMKMITFVVASAA